MRFTRLRSRHTIPASHTRHPIQFTIYNATRSRLTAHGLDYDMTHRAGMTGRQAGGKESLIYREARRHDPPPMPHPTGATSMRKTPLPIKTGHFTLSVLSLEKQALLCSAMPLPRKTPSFVLCSYADLCLSHLVM